jgi:H3 lysine-79-specific histone-lysine N-methyltransferase
MGFFDHLQKGGAFSLQPKKPQIRKVVQAKAPEPSRSPSVSAAGNGASPLPRSASTTNRSRELNGKRNSSRPQHEHPSSKQRLSTPSRNLKRSSPIQRLSSDDDSDTDTSFEVRKRVRVSASVEPDLDRRVRSVAAFSKEGDKALAMVHAADIAFMQVSGKYKRAFEGTGEAAEIVLQYPSALKGERYQLVVPRDKDDFKPLDDIVQVIETVSEHYVPEEATDEFNNESTGIKRRIRRALAHLSDSEFRQAVTDYNNAVERLVTDGSIAKHLDSTHALRLPLVERILTQIYSRTVSPRVESLRRYENGTDNVYGELLPRFISTIFKETKLKSGQVFVDLGSGVGNVVLQAALEIGCESWGCEMMPNACQLAELQQAEFKARCRLWGITPGKTRLVRGDFLKEESIIKVLERADVVLINNQAFTPQLNNELINHFLDMKEGCQIVSLKSFVPAGHKIQSRNLNSPINLLSVRQRNYWSDSVSWTDVGGTYFIATKDSSRLKKFVEEME